VVRGVPRRIECGGGKEGHLAGLMAGVCRKRNILLGGIIKGGLSKKKRGNVKNHRSVNRGEEIPTLG